MSDADRARVATRLRDAAGEGILDLNELEERLERAYGAKTVADLAEVTRDLPEPVPPPPPQRGPLGRALHDASFQGHLTTYTLTMAMLIGIWALTGGGFFWPFFPIAGWGIGLGSHFVAASQGRTHHQRSAQRHRSRDRQPPGRPLPPSRRSVPSVPPLPSGVRSDPARSFVAAMFVDVVGSTELNEAMGDEAWSRVRDRYRELVRECLDSCGGSEVSVAGDGVLARFDHPAAAVRCAIAVQRRLEDRRGEAGFAPTVRIGIHSGDVVDDGDDVIGAVVNLASRVTSAAGPSEIFVTEHVADHLGASPVTEDRGLHTLKGVAQPRHLLAVPWS